LEPAVLRDVHEGQRLEDGPERHGLAFVDLEVRDLGHGDRLEAAALDLFEDDLVDDRLRDVAQHLVLEALPDHLPCDLAPAVPRDAWPGGSTPCPAPRSPCPPPRARSRTPAPCGPRSLR